MTSPSQQLKDLNAQKKKLAAEAKALREQLSEGKEERKELATELASLRKTIAAGKTELRELSVKIGPTIKAGDVEAIDAMADSIMEVSAKLAGEVRKFGEASAKRNEL